MEPKKYAPDKSKTYTWEEIRPIIVGCIKDRAKYLGMFYKHMPRDLFDKYAKQALMEYGAIRKVKGGPNDVNTIVEFLIPNFETPGSTIGYGVVESVEDDRAVFTFHDGCALVDGWHELGFSDEEVDYLCRIACYGDIGQCESLGLKAEFPCTMTTPGKDYCKMIVRKKDAE